MERAKFKERMKALKAYKNETGKGYWDWKVRAYTDGTDGDVDPRAQIINRANEVASNYDNAKDFDLSSVEYSLRKLAKNLFGRGGISNCTLSATGWIDPNNQYMSARNIFNNPNSGYVEIDKEYALPGDLLISKNPEKDSYHTMLIEGFDNGEPLLRYSRGGHDTEENLVKSRPLTEYHKLDNEQGGNHTEDHYFRYNLYENWLPEVTISPDKVNVPAYGDGSSGFMYDYYAPTTVEGILAKTALQVADPTGISSYPDVWYSGGELINNPSWDNLGTFLLNGVSALPLMGKVTAPYKAAKMAKLLARVGDANAVVKTAEKAGDINRMIDTVPEMLPVVKQAAKKTLDLTSGLIVDPLYDFISTANKMDAVRTYRNLNAAVDVINTSNTTIDAAQGINALLKAIHGKWYNDK